VFPGLSSNILACRLFIPIFGRLTGEVLARRNLVDYVCSQRSPFAQRTTRIAAKRIAP
jgi:UPF0716 family protein affecting phage T7 exclusion